MKRRWFNRRFSPLARVHRFFERFLIRGTTEDMLRKGLMPKRDMDAVYDEPGIDPAKSSVKAFGFRKNNEGEDLSLHGPYSGIHSARQRRLGGRAPDLESWLYYAEKFAHHHAASFRIRIPKPRDPDPGFDVPVMLAIDREVLNRTESDYGWQEKHELRIFKDVPPEDIVKLFNIPASEQKEHKLRPEHQPKFRRLLAAIFSPKEIEFIFRKYKTPAHFVSALKSALVLKNTFIATEQLAEEHGISMEGGWSQTMKRLTRKFGSKAALEGEIAKKVFESEDNKVYGFVKSVEELRNLG